MFDIFTLEMKNCSIFAFVFFSVHTQVGYYYFIGFGKVFADQGSVYIIKYL